MALVIFLRSQLLFWLRIQEYFNKLPPSEGKKQEPAPATLARVSNPVLLSASGLNSVGILDRVLFSAGGLNNAGTLDCYSSACVSVPVLFNAGRLNSAGIRIGLAHTSTRILWNRPPLEYVKMSHCENRSEEPLYTAKTCGRIRISIIPFCGNTKKRGVSIF